MTDGRWGREDYIASLEVVVLWVVVAVPIVFAVVNVLGLVL